MNNFIYILVCFMGISLSGQINETLFKNSEVRNLKVIEEYYGAVGHTEEAVLLLKVKEIANGSITLEKFDQDLKLIKSKVISGITVSLNNKHNGETFEFFYQNINGDIFLFYSNLIGEFNILFRKKLNDKTLVFDAPIEVAKLPLINKKTDRRSSFGLVESDDKSHYAIYSFVTHKSEESTYSYIEVFNNQLESKWKKEETITDYKSEKLKKFTIKPLSNARQGKFPLDTYTMNLSNTTVRSNVQLSLSNKGVLNILESNEKNIYNRFYMLYAFSENNPVKKKELILKEGNLFYIDISLKHDLENNLNVIGFYDDERVTSFDGIVFEKYDPVNLDLSDQFLTKFSLEDMVRFKGVSEDELQKLEERKLVWTLYEVNDLLNIFAHSDNSFTLVSHETYAGGDGRLSVVNLSENGKTNWMKNYDKSQKRGVKEWLGVYSLMINDDIYFLYNEFEAEGALIKNKLILNKFNFGSKETSKVELRATKGKIPIFVPDRTNKYGENIFIGFAKFQSKFEILKFKIE